MSAAKAVTLLGCVLLATAAQDAAAAIVIGEGSSVDFADNTVDLGCSNLTIAGSATASAASFTSVADLQLGGSFAPGASQISLGGNFSNAGSFVPGSSQVAIIDACGGGTSQLSGATSFYDFVVATSAGKQVLFPAAVTQSVEHSLTLQGAPGHLLNVASTAAGQQGVLALANGAAQTIDYVNARDNRASVAHIAPGPPAQFHSVDGGNLVNWFLGSSGNGALASAPALGAGRWILMAALLLAAARTLFRRSRKFS